MKKIARRAALLCASLVVIAGGVVGTATSASAATAGINMVDVCHYEVSSLATPIHGSTAPSWLCHVGATNYGINLDLWCQYKYNPNAYANYTNFNDPYSWRCNY